MALNIKDPDTDRIARELAAETGESLTVAVRRAMEERLERVRARRAATDARVELADIIARGRQRATLDDRSAETILGYDEDGLPT